MEATEFLKSIIKGLVKHQDDVKVTRSLDEMGVLLSVSVHQEDMGAIIGREGNTAKSLRTILRHYGMKTGERISMLVLEPGQTEKSNYRLNRGVHSTGIA
ncbi:hypothetical protein A2Z56_02485 [Candidatus Kaiserbacteria bacterium RIFCSPHIGHO2_12_45_16]|nr:MAG: hypothetical protein A2Z56_02485 [Candidatus Kaiserbacteria bacterium RIFCSPHIGHO2_12_45_16]